LNKIGVFFKKYESTALFLYYDKNRDGKICYEEFLNSFRMELTERRLNFVKKVFKNIDLDDDLKVSVEEAEIFYRPAEVNPDFIQGKISKHDSILQFFSY